MLYFHTVLWRGWLWRRPYHYLLLDPAASRRPLRQTLLTLNPMDSPNVVVLWLEIIGTPERARKLLQEPWASCPSVALEGQEGSYRLYARPRYRPALDAWDTGMVTRRDILCWADHVASGAYAGPIAVTDANFGELLIRSLQEAVQFHSVKESVSA